MTPIPEKYRDAVWVASMIGSQYDRKLMALYAVSSDDHRERLVKAFEDVFDYWIAFAREPIDVGDNTPSQQHPSG